MTNEIEKKLGTPWLVKELSFPGQESFLSIVSGDTDDIHLDREHYDYIVAAVNAAAKSGMTIRQLELGVNIYPTTPAKDQP